MPVNSNASAKAAVNERYLLLWPVAILILVFCLWLAFILAGNVLCEIALNQIAELTDTEITTKSVDFNTDGSVYINKLVISPEQQKKYDDTILRAEKVYARFSIGSLLLLHPRLKKISIEDFVFDAQHDLDTGRWNISGFRIKPPKGAARKIPVIRLKKGMLRYSKVSNWQVKVVAALPVDAEVTPVRKTQLGYSFDITTAERAGRGKSVLRGFFKPGSITIDGGISSADIPAFEKAWVISGLSAELNYDQNNAYSLKLKIEEVRSRNTLISDILAPDEQVFSARPGPFAALQRFFSRYRPSGTFAVDLEAFGNLERLGKSRLVGKVYCKDISICDRRFPYTINHLAGRINLTERKAVLNNLAGSHGDVKVILDGWSEGFGRNCKYQLRITSDNMILEDDLYDALNADRQRAWASFSPTGLAAIDYKLSRQSPAEKEKTLEVELLGAEAAYRRFPYPLKNLSGKLLFADDSINISEVTSQVSGREITLNGRVTGYSTARPVYDILIEANDIPLDSTLARSLSDSQRDFYNQLGMTGLADAGIKVFTPEKDSGPATFVADISLKETSLKADDFPLLISDISAKTVITPGLIQVEDFSGRHNHAVVSMTGRIWPGDETQRPQYCLSLNAERAEMSDELISLMPSPLGKIVSQLHLQGELNLSAILNNTDREDCPPYAITVDCPGNSINFEEFAYPVKDITGGLTITKNTIILNHITGDLISRRDDETAVSRTPIDDTLITPDTSTVKINGQIIFTDDVLSSDRLEPIAGDVALAADSLGIKGKSLTALKVDTYYNPDRQSWMSESLIAECYGGELTGKFELKQPTETALEYHLQAGFDNVDLKQFLSDTDAEDDSPSDHTSGKMSGILSVAGRVGESLPYIGRCRLRITDMQVGKLSPLAKLLYVLKLKEPKDFAFEQMLVDSYIQHDKLFLEQFDLSGKAVAFNGSGWIDLKSHDVDLLLFARGRRITTAEPSILQSLTEGLGQAVVRIEVTGNVYDPHMNTATLPVIKEAVEILGTPRR